MTKATGKPRGRPRKAQDASSAPTPPEVAPEAQDAPTAKKRAKAGKSGGVGLNVSDGTILEFWDKAVAAKAEADRKKAEFDSANGVFRTILKAADKAGVPKAALLWRLSKRNEDVADIDRHTAWCNRVARLTNLPIGAQLGLFEQDGTTITVAAAVDKALIASRENGDGPISSVPPRNAAYTTEELTDAAWAGEEAAKGGQPRNTCPHEFGTPLADRWYVGWDDEHKRLVQIGQWNPAAPVEVTGEA